MEQSIIEIKNLVKRYKDLLALDHLNMEVRKGEVSDFLGRMVRGKLQLSTVYWDSYPMIKVR